MVRSFLILLVVFQALLFASVSANTSLKIGYYAKKCPKAETIVRKTVKDAVKKSPGLAAGLIRMHFHDCFVRGCDASVLLNSTNSRAERDAPPNNPSLRGFGVIDNAKKKLEKACPGTVSCADIIAFAARDASFYAGNIKYKVPSGRRDGMESRSFEALQHLPLATSSITQLRDSFAKKGLDLEEMVILSGAHSIGRSHCSSFTGRIYNFNSTHSVDPTLNPKYAKFLQSKCPPPGKSSIDGVANLDKFTPKVLENRYYINLQKGFGLLASDQLLQTSSLTRKFVKEYAEDDEDWKQDFAKAMVKMGKIEVLTGKQGQIRKNCRFTN